MAHALAVALNRAGYDISAVASRSFTSALSLAAKIEGCAAYRDSQAVVEACGLVFITTPDSTIAAVTSRLKWHHGQAVVHCSGADSVSLLTAATSQGAVGGVFHPLQSFAADSTDTSVFQGLTFSLEAEGPLLDELKMMVNTLGGRWMVLRAEDKALYHASAVIACNYMVTLAATASGLWSQFGVSAKEALTALLPLMRGTLSNIERTGLPDCLTGPIARGDTLTVRRHLEAIRSRAPGLETVYRELGKLTLPLVRAAGLDAAKITELTEIFADESGNQGGTE